MQSRIQSIDVNRCELYVYWMSCAGICLVSSPQKLGCSHPSSARHLVPLFWGDSSTVQTSSNLFIHATLYSSNEQLRCPMTPGISLRRESLKEFAELLARGGHEPYCLRGPNPRHCKCLAMSTHCSLPLPISEKIRGGSSERRSRLGCQEEDVGYLGGPALDHNIKYIISRCLSHISSILL